MGGEADIARIFDQLSDTLARETSQRCEALREELTECHDTVIRQLVAQLQLQLEGAVLPPADGPLTSDAPPEFIEVVAPNGGQDAAPEIEGVPRAVTLEAASGESKANVADSTTEDNLARTQSGTQLGAQNSGIANQNSVVKTNSAWNRKAKLAQLNKESLVQEDPFYVNQARDIIHSARFELFVTCLIVASIVVIVIQVQSTGIDMGYHLGYPSVTSTPFETAPGLQTSLEVLDVIFGVMFTVEILLRFMADPLLSFFKSFSNIMDLTIVVFWIVQMSAAVASGLSPLVLRILRLFKVLRLLRMIRSVENIDSLWLLTESIKASQGICFWSTLLLLMMQMTVGVLLHESLAWYIKDESGGTSKEVRMSLYGYFGTFSRTMVTMIEVTIANPSAVTRLLQGVDEWYAFVLVSYKLTIGFAAIRIISGVFMSETIRVANSNDDIMVLQKERKVAELRQKMGKLFDAADASGDGKVTIDEFCSILEIGSVKTWLAAQDLEVKDASMLFEELAGGDDNITFEEMIKGVSFLRGPARSQDVIHVLRCQDKLALSLQRIEAGLNRRPSAHAPQARQDYSRSTQEEPPRHFSQAVRGEVTDDLGSI